MMTAMNELERTDIPPEPRWKRAGPPYLLTRDEFFEELQNQRMNINISERQLRSWVSYGLLPRPVRRAPPGANDGVARALYPIWIMGLIFDVQYRLAMGQHIDDVKKYVPALTEVWQKREHLFLPRAPMESTEYQPLPPGIWDAAMHGMERALWSYTSHLLEISEKRVAHAVLTLWFEDGSQRIASLEPYPPEQEKDQLTDIRHS
jgi:hypothetical protein